MISKGTILSLLSCFVVAYSLATSAASTPESTPLPQPLTLKQALSFAADVASPDIAVIDSQKMALTAADKSLIASDSTQVSLNGQLQWAEPIATPGTWVDNHKASLKIQKNIYDFGRVEGNRVANRMALDALQSELVSAQWKRREEIMSHFFNVLLADLTADRNEEEMAGAFIGFDRISERQKLGQASDLEVLKKEAFYQTVFLKRNQGIAQQRITRSQLAITLNHTGDLPENLFVPQLPSTYLPIPEFEIILKRAMGENRELNAINRKIEATQQEIGVTSKGVLPTINGEIELADTTRPGSQSDRWRVGLMFSMPLYDGGRTKAGIAKGKANIYKLKATRDGLKSKIEQSVLNEWSSLNSLRQQAKAALVELDYRELYLDNSRAEYELEFKTDLGNAMVKISEAQLAIAKNRYQQALVWERLDALTNGSMNALSSQMASGQQAKAAATDKVQ